MCLSKPQALLALLLLVSETIIAFIFNPTHGQKKQGDRDFVSVSFRTEFMGKELILNFEKWLLVHIMLICNHIVHDLDYFVIYNEGILIL